MQQSPYFNNALSPSENSKFIPSLQYFNGNYNYLCSPRTLFFGLNLSNSSGGNNKKFILSKMKFSSSNKKVFLSNKIKRNSDSYEKKNKKNITTNNNINNDSSVFINETKASTKKNNSTQNITNSAFIRMNKSVYIGSVKKNLLPSLSNELKSNTKIKKNVNENNNNILYDNLCKTAENLDLEKMVDYIVSSTKIYNRYNDNKENIDTNNFNFNTSEKKGIESKNINLIDEKNMQNIQINQKNFYSLCKCKRVECLKYSCSCLKSGNKCNNLCSCINCKNRESNIFKIDS